MDRNSAEPAPGGPPAPMRRGRGRPPSAEVRRRILDTAAAVMLECGVSEITFDKVARRAGVSRMTLYKWFRSPGSLALTAFVDGFTDTLVVASTDDVWDDLRTQLRQFVAVLSHPRVGPMVAGLLGAAQTDSALAAEISTIYTQPRRQAAVELLDGARNRGQLPFSIDVEVLVDQLWGACYARLLLREGDLDEAFADGLVANVRVATGAQPLTARDPRRSS
jgi:AcrR family transcriptional regulator